MLTLSRRGRVFVLMLGSTVLGCDEREQAVDSCAEIPGPVVPVSSDGEGGAAGDTAEPEVSGGAAGASEPGEPPIVSDEYAGDVSVSVHPRVRTILVVDWTQTLAAGETWLEFWFDGGPVMRSRPKPGGLGQHRDVVLGVPEQTEVTLRIVSRTEAGAFASSDFQATTGPLPSGLPKPTIFARDLGRASPERWLLGSVEDSRGGGYVGYYLDTFWLYVMDREGRIVWYYSDPASNATSSFQRVSRDGEYLWIEKRAFNRQGSQSVVKATLDFEYFEEILVPGLSDCIDVTDDGSLLYDVHGELHERRADGTDRVIWSCRDHFGPGFDCYTNTVNWYAGDDSVLLSFPYQNTVVEIARANGGMVGQYGAARGSLPFAPPLASPPQRWAFSFQHFPNRTASGTLLVSSHVPGCTETAEPGPHRHAFVEFEIDRAAGELRERWRYTGGLEWPRAKGMAIRLANGNTLANYGTGGVIREITPDGRTVFGVKFDSPGGNDFYNKMVGHNVLIDDLYALNGGP